MAIGNPSNRLEIYDAESRELWMAIYGKAYGLLGTTTSNHPATYALNGKRKNFSWLAKALGAWLAVSCLTVDCGEPPGDSELKQAIKVVRYTSSKRQLARSSFALLNKDMKPSKFVGWMFSTIGSAEWFPPSTLEFSLEELKMIQRSGIPLLPENVSIVPYKPDPRLGKQVVVKADDARHMIITEGYLDPTGEPVLFREWKMPVIH